MTDVVPLANATINTQQQGQDHDHARHGRQVDRPEAGAETVDPLVALRLDLAQLPLGLTDLAFQVAFPLDDRTADDLLLLFALGRAD